MFHQLLAAPNELCPFHSEAEAIELTHELQLLSSKSTRHEKQEGGYKHFATHFE